MAISNTSAASSLICSLETSQKFNNYHFCLDNRIKIYFNYYEYDYNITYHLYFRWNKIGFVWHMWREVYRENSFDAAQGYQPFTTYSSNLVYLTDTCDNFHEFLGIL